jgi:hypothetical protein
VPRIEGNDAKSLYYVPEEEIFRHDFANGSETRVINPPMSNGDHWHLCGEEVCFIEGSSSSGPNRQIQSR